MKKNNFIYCIAALLIFSIPLFAQNRERNNDRGAGRESFNREEMTAKRNTFLTEKMELTAEETAVFIPLDNELLRKKTEIGRDCRRFERELRDKTEKTDEDFQKLLRCKEEVKGKRENLDREYHEKFKKVLSAEKLIKYQDADKAFFEEFIRGQR